MRNLNVLSVMSWRSTSSSACCLCLDRCVDDGRGDEKMLFVLAGGGGAGDWMLVAVFGLTAVLVAKQNEFDVATRPFLHCFVPKLRRRSRVRFAGSLRRTSFHGRALAA